MTNNEKNMAKTIANTLAYCEMTDEQLELVAQYETAIYQPKVDILKKRFTKEAIEEQIHDWWLNYEIADETEKNLINYLNS